MLTAVFLVCAILFLVAFFTYGRFLERRLGIDNSRPTPSHTDYDGVDRVPAHPAVLFGHHFSSIAGAGPIVGPIIAAVAFGWAVPLVWVVVGAIFIGGAHDFASLAASVRNRGRSIADIARESMSPLAYRLLLIFMWLALVYVLTVFTDLTATTFVEDGGVATSSWLFVALAICFGLSVYRFKIPVVWSTLIFVPLVFLATWVGQLIPISSGWITSTLGSSPVKVWSMALIAYCFVASVTPVWILLQPRDYLSSFLLYASMLLGLVGIVFGGFDVQFPAFITWDAAGVGPLFPIVFITVACGACSGFHSLVASGTTSKQLDKESHARTVGYGAMLVEGLVAVIALATVMMLASDDPLRGKPPLTVYGTGISRFAAVIGIPEKLGFSFGLLALFDLHPDDAGHGDASGPLHFRGVLPVSSRSRPVRGDAGDLGAADHVRARQLEGRCGAADPGVEGDLAGLRGDQPTVGGFDVRRVGRVAAEDEAKDRVYLGAFGLYDGSHAVCAGSADPAIRSVADRCHRRRLAGVGHRVDRGSRPHESAAIRGDRGHGGRRAKPAGLVDRP